MAAPKEQCWEGRGGGGGRRTNRGGAIPRESDKVIGIELDGEEEDKEKSDPALKKGKKFSSLKE